MTHRFYLEYHLNGKDGKISVVCVSKMRHSLGLYPSHAAAVAEMDRWESRASGWIVFVRDGRLVKIGRTLKSPIAYLLNMQKGNAQPLELANVLDVGRESLRLRENAIHRYWHARRSKTEWFRITQEELASFLEHEMLRILQGELVPAKDTIDTKLLDDATVDEGLPAFDEHFAEKYVEQMRKRAPPDAEEAISPLTAEDLDALDAVQTSKGAPQKSTK